MNRFFRRIRQQTLSENKVTKYVVYAFGEIVLVVIGILIALQINNWNELRKAKVFERNMLNDINDSVIQNIWELEAGIRENRKAQNSAYIILDHLNNDLPYNDSLDVHFSVAIGWFHTTIKNNAYESLKSYGMHIVTNDSIRKTLGIYEIGWFQTLNQRQEEYYFGTVSPVLAKLFQSVEFFNEMKPNDYEALKKSNIYKTILRSSIANRKIQIDVYSDWLENQFGVRKLHTLINSELERMGNL